QGPGGVDGDGALDDREARARRGDAVTRGERGLLPGQDVREPGVVEDLQLVDHGGGGGRAAHVELAAAADRERDVEVHLEAVRRAGDQGRRQAGDGCQRGGRRLVELGAHPRRGVELQLREARVARLDPEGIAVGDGGRAGAGARGRILDGQGGRRGDR